MAAFSLRIVESKAGMSFAIAVSEVASERLHKDHITRPPPEEGYHMSVLGWILFGLVVGIIGKLLMPGRDPGGFIVTILLGIAGALLGGYIGRALGMYREDDPVGFIMAVIGSIVLLVIYRFAFVGRSTI
jgi:uncharacterized membrane protein YeaQ/YmgE (transglycosylase-associated protein family)